jgi:4-diphosphocytidyl-2-C-methyl-D-erythritol kinase
MLRVVGRRDDGYHLLQTVFQFLDFGDAIQIVVRPDGALRAHYALPGVPPERDLLLRAAHRLQQATGCRQGADIGLIKRIPMGGGLGGGSSDAATVLVALNALWGTGLSREHLAAMGLGLGADVPVFVHGEAAWAEGIGERLTTVRLPESWYLVLVPRVTVPTATIFAAPELTRNSPRITIANFLAGQIGNDCEPVVRRRYPEVATVLDWLGQFADARLTGTGSCVFAAFAEAEQAQAVAARVPQGWKVLLARGCNRSPLLSSSGG